ncbi:MAG: hypothetical protein ACP5NM_01200 [Thiomonas sp.]
MRQQADMRRFAAGVYRFVANPARLAEMQKTTLATPFSLGYAKANGRSFLTRPPAGQQAYNNV